MHVAADSEIRLEPSLEQARELASAGNVVPVRARLVDDCETPVSAFLKLRTDGPCFLLESAEQGRLGRYSFLGFSPRAILRWQKGVLSEWPGDASAGDEPRPHRHDVALAGQLPRLLEARLQLHLAQVRRSHA